MNGGYVQLMPWGLPFYPYAGGSRAALTNTPASEFPSERDPGGHEAVVVHKLPEIEDVHVGIKIGDKFPFQGGHALEGGAEVPVLVHPLNRALQDEGGETVDLAVITL